MSLNLRRVTVFEESTDPTTGDRANRLIEFHPAMRLRGEGAEYPIFLQDGQMWGEGGDPLSLGEAPAWVAVEMGKCSAAALRACGFGPPPDVVTQGVPGVQASRLPPGYWECPDCGDLVREGREARHQEMCEPEEKHLDIGRKGYWLCPECGEEVLGFHRKTHQEACRAANDSRAAY